MLLMFVPAKTARLFTSDAPSGPRSWFKLACATERGLLILYALLPLVLTVFLWMLDFLANGVNTRNLKIFEHLAVSGWECMTSAAGVVHLLIYMTANFDCFCARLTELSSLDMLAFRTEWLLNVAPILWMPALSTLLLSNFPIWVLPSGALMYHISPFSRRLPCLTAWLLHFHWPVIPEKLVKFYGTPFSSFRVNLRLECSLVAKFLPLSCLRPRFINPNKHFAAILERILL